MNHQERAHAALSPSSFKRLMECPGSYYLTKDMPDSQPSKYAAEGTAVHEIIEKLWNVCSESGAIFPKDIEAYTDDPDIQECVRGYFEFCFDLEEKFKALCDTEEKSQVKRFIEKRIHLTENIWGTVDYALSGMRNGKLEILVVDFKFGAGVKVKAKDNPQLVIYGLGINKELDNKAHKIRCYIYQPRAGGEKAHSSFILEKEDIESWNQTIKEAENYCLSLVKEYSEDLEAIGVLPIETHLNSGDHCRFCKAIATCPERNKTALSMIEPIKEARDLPLIPTEKLVEIFKAKKQFEYMLDAVEAHLTRLAESGVEIPGLKLVQTKGKRSWAFKGAELGKKLEEALDKIGLPADMAYQPGKPITLLEAEKLLGKNSISELISLPSVRNQLVADEDERTEVEIVNLIEEIK